VRARVRACARARRQARVVIQTWGLCVSSSTTSGGGGGGGGGDARHRDAAYRQREV